MENLVVATFQNEKDANSGLNKLKELDQIGDITIYNIVMIKKNSLNDFELFYHSGPDTQYLPASGALAGSVIGALAGPIGLSMGFITGAMIGGLNREDYEEFASSFLDKVNQQLLPGTLAIVMHVEEDEMLFINSYLETFHAQVVHKDITDQYSLYDQQQWQALNREIEKEEQELKKASDEEKAAIKARIRELKEERNEKMKKFKSRMAAAKDQMRSKIRELDHKMENAHGKLKERIKTHKHNLESRLKKRSREAEKTLA